MVHSLHMLQSRRVTNNHRAREQITWVSYKFLERQYVYCPHFGLTENARLLIITLVINSVDKPKIHLFYLLVHKWSLPQTQYLNCKQKTQVKS